MATTHPRAVGDEKKAEEAVHSVVTAAPLRSIGWRCEPYTDAKKRWPREGKHILAQFCRDWVVVYQAFNAEIAKYAVANQKFIGAPGYLTRTTWIKTNFLWMMYRSGWGTKDPNQTHTLRLRLRTSFFLDILKHAKTSGKDKEGTVRLQWDPDHAPVPPYASQERRAIQLGLNGIWQERLASGEGLIDIVDISAFVAAQHPLTAEDADRLQVPVEDVYPVDDADIVASLGLSPCPAEE